MIPREPTQGTAAQCPIHPMRTQPCGICCGTLDAAPKPEAAAPAPDADGLIKRLRDMASELHTDAAANVQEGGALLMLDWTNGNLLLAAADTITAQAAQIAEKDAEVANLRDLLRSAEAQKERCAGSTAAEWRQLWKRAMSQFERAEAQIAELATTAQREVDNALRAEAERDKLRACVDARESELYRKLTEIIALTKERDAARAALEKP